MWKSDKQWATEVAQLRADLAAALAEVQRTKSSLAVERGELVAARAEVDRLNRLITDSDLEPVECGGMSAGDYIAPRVTRLLHKHRKAEEKHKTELLRQCAAQAHQAHQCHEWRRCAGALAECVYGIVTADRLEQDREALADFERLKNEPKP